MKPEKISDQWQTPQWLFDEISKEHGPFDIDLCAIPENSKCHLFYRDYLNNILAEYYYEFDDWMFPVKPPKDVICFMNPPYSNPKPFIEKAWEDSKHCKIVALVKCDPSTKWWATFWNYAVEDKVWVNPNDDNCFKVKTIYYNGPKPGCEVRFFPKRIQFDPPQQLINSGGVWKIGNKWVQKCEECLGRQFYISHNHGFACPICKGKGYKELSGPTFPSALIIMDRRGLE